MPSVVITCPNSNCGLPLRLNTETVGQPLSCPHCRTVIRVGLDGSGQPTEPQVVPAGRRIPIMLLIPGFALLILGVAGVFVNGYVATDAASRPGADLEHARRIVADVRQARENTSSGQAPNKGEPLRQEEFAAVLGTAATEAARDEYDAKWADGWAPHIVWFHAVFAAVSFVMAVGGVSILQGKWYPLAFVGCAAAILNLNLACCMIGGVAGVWGLLVLVRDDGRKHFGM